MGLRRQSRELALGALYLVDVSGMSPEQALMLMNRRAASGKGASMGEPRRTPEAFAGELALGACKNIKDLDARIEERAKNWKIPRMGVADRNILRLAAYELLFTDAPPKVVINEAIEIARKFSGEEATAFINGILDKIKAPPSA